MEEAFDDLFAYKEGNEADYFSPEGPKDQLHYFGSFGKGEVAARGDENEAVEIPETPGTKDRSMSQPMRMSQLHLPSQSPRSLSLPELFLSRLLLAR